MVVATVDSKGLIDRVSAYLPQEAAKLVGKAFVFADQCHQGQMRVSGEPYIAHPLETALFLANLHLDHHTIVAALLHDVVEDCGVTLEELDSKFGNEVTKLVDGVTKLTRMDDRFLEANPDSNLSEEQDHLYAESLRKMLVAMAEDIRVVLIKLADRLHNMRTLDALAPEKRRRIAQETLDIYSPLAHRLGIWEIKWQLDDLAFRHLNEEKYHEIAKMLAAKREEREAYVEKVASRLREEMITFNVEGEVAGRPKGIYSTHLKIERYATQGKELSDIYDLYALRVLVNSMEDCYKTLGVIHQLWHPIPGQFDDYIANPKENLYQALHSTVICDGGNPLEVQIKTFDLHQIAEYGVAAHWQYKEGKSGDLRFEEKMTWLRQLLEWQREMAGTDEFIESVKQDIFHDQVFVYTPKGEIVELTSGSTPIDFGYKIHTDLGHRCVGAKVNGRLVSLDTKLKNGDTVEIMTSKGERGPSLDWLNPNRGYVGSASARQKVRLWFRRQARSSNIQRGRELLRRELRRVSQKLEDAEIVTLCKFDNMDELLANLGSGGLTESQLAYRLSQASQEHQPEQPVIKPNLPLSSPSSGVSVLGVGDLLTRIAQCCNPIPGDEIVGYITRGRGVSIHRTGCTNIPFMEGEDRFIFVEWDVKSGSSFIVRLKILFEDRKQLLKDITESVAALNMNITSIDMKANEGIASCVIILEVRDIHQLERLTIRIQKIPNLIQIERI